MNATKTAYPGRKGATPAARGEARRAARGALFLRAAVPDFIFALIAATALVFTVSYGFESAPDLRSNVLLCAGLAAPMLAILYAGSWSKRAVAPAAVAAVVYGAVVIAALAAQIPEGTQLLADGQINDVAENPVLFGAVAVLVPVAVYLLSRRRWGVVLLFVFCAVSCGAIQFLYRDWSTAQPGTIAALVAVLACGALYVYQGYRSSVYEAKRVPRTSFGGAAAFALALSVLCVVAGCGVFYGVIEPLGLETPQVKPFQDYYQKPVVEYRSVYEQQDIENPDVLTNQTNDEQEDSNQDAEGGVEGQTSQDQQDWSGSPLSALMRNTLSFDAEDWNETFQTISYQALALGALIIALIVAAAIAAIVLLQRWRRARRLRKLAGEPRAYGIWYLYTFITKRLERLGFVRPETFTPLEFALASRGALAPFARNTNGVDYLELTLIYQRACYAPETLTEKDESETVRYYRAFFDNARRFVGSRRWLWKFWFI